MTLNFMSLNVKGLNSPYTTNTFCKDLRSQKGDILFLQETLFAKSISEVLNSPFFPNLLGQMLHLGKELS